MKPLAFTTVLGLLPAVALADDPVDRLTGVWETEDGKSRVQIHPCPADDSLCGTIVWTHNDDLTKIGLRILDRFTFTGKRWEDGEIVDPRSGRSYRARLIPESDTELEVKGCWFIFCGGQTWTRVSARMVETRTGADDDAGPARRGDGD